VSTEFPAIAGLTVVSGRFFDQDEEAAGSSVAVIGEGARRAIFGREEAVGKYVKVDDTWLRVVGVLAAQATYHSDVEGLSQEDRNLNIYVPINAASLRFSNNQTNLKDEIDGIYMRLANSGQSLETAEVVRAILDSTHRGAADFSVIVPAGLLEEQRRTKMIFNFVMVAIAGISLLVGGIGIMNIMLATVLERTREIGIRRAIGARRRDIVRQFLLEATMISIAGGIIGILFGFALSRLVAFTAGWSTIISPAAVLVAFSVSVTVGLVFGLYPARQAAMLDPIEAIRYE
jgi:putative ABC transport system permease protein